MNKGRLRLSRRAFLAASAATVAAAPLGLAAETDSARLTGTIPGSGEKLPAIGMGSWITFDVGDDRGQREQRVRVLRAFFDAGGGMIDSSPMYGSSEEVIGFCLRRIADTSSLFSATKVWTPAKWHGVKQIEDSQAFWGFKKFDLLQVHNLVAWAPHLETLRELKARGQLRYIGLTTSHGRRHAELAKLMAEQPIDFVQFTYNILDREAEQRLLPLAVERGLAVIANRPFQRGGLFNRVNNRPLPDWAGQFDCANWAQFFLKFIVSHPAVTCAIPATSRVDHMQENMGAGVGWLPDLKMRQRMVRYVESL